MFQKKRRMGCRGSTGILTGSRTGCRGSKGTFVGFGFSPWLETMSRGGSHVGFQWKLVCYILMLLHSLANSLLQQQHSWSHKFGDGGHAELFEFRLSLQPWTQTQPLLLKQGISTQQSSSLHCYYTNKSFILLYNLLTITITTDIELKLNCLWAKQKNKNHHCHVIDKTLAVTMRLMTTRTTRDDGDNDDTSSSPSSISFNGCCCCHWWGG